MGVLTYMGEFVRVSSEDKGWILIQWNWGAKAFFAYDNVHSHEDTIGGQGWGNTNDGQEVINRATVVWLHVKLDHGSSTVEFYI